MTTVIMRRTMTGLAPSDMCQYEELMGNRIKLGDEVKCVITKPRNLPFLRKYMVMLRACFDMQDSFSNFEHWRAAVQIAAGHCSTIINHKGEANYIPDSISFANCDETKFQRVYDNALTAICEHWVNDEPEQIKIICEFS